MKRSIKMVALFIVAIFLFTGCSLVEVDPNKDKQLPVAEVNGQTILKGDFLEQYNYYIQSLEQQFGVDKKTLETQKDYAETLKNLKEEIVDGLITMKLMEQQADKMNITLTDDDKKQVDDMLQQLKDSYGSENFNNILSQQQITEQELRDMYLKDARMQKLVDQLTADVSVSEDEINKYYQDNKDTMFTEPETVTIRDILISIPQDKVNADDATKEAEYEKIKPEAQQVLDKVNSGEDFAKLVEQYSDDQDTKQQGGQLTLAKGDPLDSALIEAAFALKNPGDVSGLVKASAGYYIIKLESRNPAKVYTLDEVKQQINDDLLMQKKDDKMSSIIEAWKKDANIKKYTKNYL